MVIKKYRINGITVATDWYDNKRYMHLFIETDEEGLDRIKIDPLQDYPDFGFQSVDYVYLNVYRADVAITKDFLIERVCKNPVVIEKGKKPNDPDINKIWEFEPIAINYY